MLIPAPNSFQSRIRIRDPGVKKITESRLLNPDPQQRIFQHFFIFLGFTKSSKGASRDRILKIES
jgi:hypothetical protein